VKKAWDFLPNLFIKYSGMVEILLAKYLGINSNDSNIKNIHANQSKLANTIPLVYAAPKLATSMDGLTLVLNIERPTLYQGNDLPDKNKSSALGLPKAAFFLLMNIPTRIKKMMYNTITIESVAPIWILSIAMVFKMKVQLDDAFFHGYLYFTNNHEKKRHRLI
jgi:hypothetical protein